MVRSERQSQSESELPFIVLRARDFQEASAPEIVVRVVDSRVVEMRAIEKIGGIHTELQAETLRNLKVAKQAEIQVHRARPEQGISANISVCICGGVRKCGWVVERRTRTNAAKFLDGSNQIGRLGLAHAVQRR